MRVLIVLLSLLLTLAFVTPFSAQPLPAFPAADDPFAGFRGNDPYMQVLYYELCEKLIPEAANGEHRKTLEQFSNAKYFQGRPTPEDELEVLRGRLTLFARKERAEQLKKISAAYQAFTQQQKAVLNRMMAEIPDSEGAMEKVRAQSMKRLDEMQAKATDFFNDEIQLLTGEDPLRENKPTNQDAVNPLADPTTNLPQPQDVPPDTPQDDPVIEKIRNAYEEAIPSLQGEDYEITRYPLSIPQRSEWDDAGVYPPNCFSYVLGVTNSFTSLMPTIGGFEVIHPWLAPYETLDETLSGKGYHPQEPFNAAEAYPEGTVLVYSKFSSGTEYPNHVAIMNTQGKWESVTGPGGALITHTNPQAMASEGRPRLVYVPK